VYVPVPPVPDPNAVIMVPGANSPVVSVRICATANAPAETAETVNVFPAIVHVNCAPGILGEAISNEIILTHDPKAATAGTNCEA